MRAFKARKLRYWSGASFRRLLSIAAAALDARAPLPAKAVALFTVIYALSPIDLVPDFIPIMGWLDDAVVIPLGLWLTARLMPPGLLQEHYERRAPRLPR